MRDEENSSVLSSTTVDVEVPEGVDRRSFLMRSAVIGAAVVITGAEMPARSEGRGGRRRRAAREAAGLDHVPGPERGQEGQGPGDDRARRVLQGRPRPLELAHHRADADHLRLLPALHEAARRPAGEGDRPEGPPVRQPQRHRQGARHRARHPRGAARQGAGHGRPAVPRRDGGEARPDLPGEARRQDLQRSPWPTSSTMRPRATSRTRTP